MLNKAEIRRTLLEKRSALDADVRSQWNKAIASHLLEWQQHNPVAVIGVYWPIRGEPKLHDAYAALAQAQVTLALPVVVAKDAALAFARWTPGDAVVVDKYGIAVPANPQLVSPDALLIPCVGFNVQRFRLGYGGGYYDRTLAPQPRPRAIGIAYSCLRTDFEADPHDIPLDVLITEQGKL